MKKIIIVLAFLFALPTFAQVQIQPLAEINPIADQPIITPAPEVPSQPLLEDSHGSGQQLTHEQMCATGIFLDCEPTQEELALQQIVSLLTEIIRLRSN